jgi:hypothetical protein
MKSYAQVEKDRNNGRRHSTPIYDDPGLGYWNEGPRPTNDVPESDVYKTVWPEGYWELYADLQKVALEVSEALDVHMVMCMDNKFCVYALMPAGKAVREGGVLHGPKADDRIAAWKAFIRTFAPKSVTIPAGTVKLGSPNANNDVMVDGEKFAEQLKGLTVEHLGAPTRPVKLAVKTADKQGLDQFAAAVEKSGTFDKKLTDSDVTVSPKKGKKGRKA